TTICIPKLPEPLSATPGRAVQSADVAKDRGKSKDEHSFTTSGDSKRLPETRASVERCGRRGRELLAISALQCEPGQRWDSRCNEFYSAARSGPAAGTPGTKHKYRRQGLTGAKMCEFASVLNHGIYLSLGKSKLLFP